MKSVLGLALICATVGTTAQTYRLHYQPKVGSVARHEIVVRVSGQSADLASAPELSAGVVLRTEQKFTKVTSTAVEGVLTVRAVAMSEPSEENMPPDFKVWRQGYKQKFSYAPHCPFAFLESVAPPAEKGNMNASSFVPAPAIPSAKVTVGDYWDVTKSAFRSLGETAEPGSVPDISAIGQAVTQFLEVDSQGVGQFETTATLPLEIATGFLDMKLDLRMASTFGIHMATSTLRSLETRSRVSIEMGGGPASEGGAPAKAIGMTIGLVMRVRTLD